MPKEKILSLPSAIPIEMCLLGELMRYPDTVDTVMEIVSPEYFYRPDHKKIFQAMAEMHKKGEAIDLETVFVKMGGVQTSEDNIGSYLASLSSKSISSAHAEDHANIVKEKYVRRSGINIFLSAEGNLRNGDGKVNGFQILHDTEKAISDLLTDKQTARFYHIGGVLVDEFNKAGDIKQKKGGCIGIPTGLPSLNKITGGWQPGDMIIVAGRPSQGKTNLGLHFARTAAVNNKVSVMIFSMETTVQKLTMRMLCSESKIDSRKVKCGELDSSEWDKMNKHLSRLADAPIFIDDSSSLSIDELQSSANLIIKTHQVGLVIVDYLGLINPSNKSATIYQQTTEISKGLKKICKKLGVPIIILCQLNRYDGELNGTKPNLRALRDSGAIEQDSDMVLFVYRPSMYKANKEDDKTKTELIVGKNREGPRPTINLKFYEESGYIIEEDKTHEETPY